MNSNDRETSLRIDNDDRSICRLLGWHVSLVAFYRSSQAILKHEYVVRWSPERLREWFSPLSNGEIDQRTLLHTRTDACRRKRSWNALIRTRRYIVTLMCINGGAVSSVPSGIYISLFHNGRGWCARRVSSWRITKGIGRPRVPARKQTFRRDRQRSAWD